MTDWLKVRRFFDWWGAGPRSWLGHAFVAALLTLIFRPETAIVAYLFREGAEVYYNSWGDRAAKVDHAMDFFCPTVAALVVWWIRT